MLDPRSTFLGLTRNAGSGAENCWFAVCQRSVRWSISHRLRADRLRMRAAQDVRLVLGRSTELDSDEQGLIYVITAETFPLDPDKDAYNPSNG